MAYNLTRKNVLDLKPSTGVGVALPFNNPSVFTSIYTTNEQLKYNIINYLLTDTRERVFNPTFGAGLRSRLFEQITSESNETLLLNLQHGLEQNFPAIQITALDVISDPDTNTIHIQFSYTILRNNQTDTITVNIQNG